MAEGKYRVYQVDDSKKVFGKVVVYLQYDHDNDNIVKIEYPARESTDCTFLAHMLCQTANDHGLQTVTEAFLAKR